MTKRSIPAAAVVLMLAATAVATPITTVTLTSSYAGETVSGGATIDWTISVSVSTADNAGLAMFVCDLMQNTANPAAVDLSPADSVPSGMADFARPLGISNPGSGAPDFGYRGAQRSPTGETYLNLVQIGGAQNTLGTAGPTGVGEDYTVDTAIAQSSAQIVASGSFVTPNVAGTYTFDVENVLSHVLSSVTPAPAPPEPWPVEAATANTDGASFSIVVEETLAGDLNCDGVVNSDDIPHFMQALLDPAGYAADHDGDPYDSCQQSRADLNMDADANGLDVQMFVDQLIGG